MMSCELIALLDKINARLERLEAAVGLVDEVPEPELAPSEDEASE